MNHDVEKGINKDDEICTSVIGDFILRWGLLSLVVGLMFASAFNKKDFEKQRLQYNFNNNIVISEKKENIEKECIDNLIKKINLVPNAPKNINDIIIDLAKNNFVLENKPNKAFTANDEIYYQIKYCEKKFEFLNNLKIKELEKDSLK